MDETQLEKEITMKKLILFALIAIVMVGCVKIEIKNPLDYRGAVVTGNSGFLGDYKLQLQLTKAQSDSLNHKYLWIYVTEFDYMRYSLGDTIK